MRTEREGPLLPMAIPRHDIAVRMRAAINRVDAMTPEQRLAWRNERLEDGVRTGRISRYREGIIRKRIELEEVG